VKVSTLVEELMVQPVAPADCTAYVIAPSPEDDAANGVFGDCAVVSAVVGDHDTVWVGKVGVAATDAAELLPVPTMFVAATLKK
jgi:hypothetical protein